jgi:hypothetical protein
MDYPTREELRKRSAEKIEEVITALIVKNTGEIRQRLWNVEQELEFAKALISRMDGIIFTYNRWTFTRNVFGYWWAKHVDTNEILSIGSEAFHSQDIFRVYEELRSQGKLK